MATAPRAKGQWRLEEAVLTRHDRDEPSATTSRVRLDHPGCLTLIREGTVVPVTVERATVIDPVHYNGDPFWDGDQTLYELTVRDATERADLRFVVARGDAFITAEQVARHVERLEESVDALRVRGQRPEPDRHPQIRLPIEPGDE